MSNKNYGATPAEWDHFSLMLGLTADMLPCVADPKAKISALSTLKSVGKTPSRLDGKGEVVGIAKWTSLKSNDAQITSWRNHGQYSISLQARSVKGVDIDVSDVELAGAIRARFCQMLGVLPARGRAGSSRVLLGLTLTGAPEAAAHKRVIKLLREGGIVEYLTNGQQFVAAGTHTSGSRYYWDGGLPDAFPEVEWRKFDACWHAVEREFGVVDDGCGSGDRYSETSAEVAELGSGSCGASEGGESEAGRSEVHRGSGRQKVNGQAGRDRAVDGSVGGTSGSGTGASGAGGAKHAPVKRAPDPVAVWLKKRGWITGRNKEKLFVACPWADDHTADSGESATAWFLAGTNGYINGHFECLHAHCAKRTDDQFLQAVGFNQSYIEQFEVVPMILEDKTERLPPTASWAGDGSPGSGLRRSKKGWLATADNIGKALQTPGFWRRVARDKFRDQVMWSFWDGAGGWHPWVETDYTRFRIELEQNGFEPMGKELLRDSVRLVAETNSFDAAQDWLNSLVWDGVPRIGTFMKDYLGAEESNYSTEVGRYLWSALAGRCLEPGVKADMVPVFVSVQGTGKSSAVEVLSPSIEFYGVLDWHDKEDNILRKMRGRMVMEMAELKGLRNKEQEAIKAFISQRYDSWVPKYAELEVTLPRRVLIIGTSNDDEILSDETGNRRWLPIKVGVADLEMLAKDREQLWAEGANLFKNFGVAWAEAQRLSTSVHDDFMSSDDWEENIARFLESEREDEINHALKWKESRFSTKDVLVSGLGFDLRSVTQQHQRRVAKILKRRGFETRVGKDSHQKSYRYYYLSTLSTL